MKRTGWIALAALLGIAGPLHAATHYFNNSTGNDTTGDGSIGNPWKTFSKAQTECTAGDICDFAGTYTTNLVAVGSGASGNVITFRANSGSGAVINCGGTSNWGINAGGYSYLAFDGFEITNCNGGGATANGNLNEGSNSIIPGTDAGTAVQFKNLHIHDQGGHSGVSISGTIDGLIENCHVHNVMLAAAGLRAKGVTRPIIRGCTAELLNGDGAHMFYATDGLVETTIIRDFISGPQHSDGLMIGHGTNITVRRCRISDFTQLIYGSATSDSPETLTNIWIYANIFYSNSYNNGDLEGPPSVFFDLQDPTPGEEDQAHGIYIVGNTFGATGYPAIWVFQGSTPSTNVKAANNVFYKVRNNNVRSAMDISNMTGRLSNYNMFVICYGESFEGGNSIYSTDGTTGALPRFPYTGYGSASLDFRIPANSDCIDAAAPNLASLLGVSLPSGYCDYAGLPRNGTASDDLGAYMYDSGATPTAPDPPPSLTATPVSPTRIDLAWGLPPSDGGSDLTGYKIEFETPIGGGFTTLVANTGNTQRSYSHTALTEQTQYNYRVSAINAIGTSSPSPEDDATTLASGEVSTGVQRRVAIGIGTTLYRNIAGQRVPIYAFDNNGLAVTGDAANITAKISRNGGAATPLVDVNPIEIDATNFPGIYIFDVTQAETNADFILIGPTSTTTDVLVDPQLIYTRVYQSGDGYAAAVSFGTQLLTITTATNNNVNDIHWLTDQLDSPIDGRIVVTLDGETVTLGTTDATNLGAIKSKTDLMNFASGDLKATLDGETVKLAADGLDNVIIDGGYNARETLAFTASALLANYSRTGNTSTFKAMGDANTTRMTINTALNSRTVLSLTAP